MEGSSSYLCPMGRLWKGNRAGRRSAGASFGLPGPQVGRLREPEAPAAWRGRIQPESESGANKSKEKQLKPRKKAWISLHSLGRIGTFQCFTGTPNKKISPASNSTLRLCARTFQPPCPFSSSCRERYPNQSGEKDHSTNSGFLKLIARFPAAGQ
jgi:hypothetical protein